MCQYDAMASSTIKVQGAELNCNWLHLQTLFFCISRSGADRHGQKVFSNKVIPQPVGLLHSNRRLRKIFECVCTVPELIYWVRCKVGKRAVSDDHHWLFIAVRWSRIS